MNAPVRNDKLHAWLKKALKASPYKTAKVCETAGTSVAMLRQWASGRRNMSADSAEKLEAAMLADSVRRPCSYFPKPLDRLDLCAACSRCPHALTHTDRAHE